MKNLLKPAKRMIIKNAPLIMTGIGTVGIFVTAFFSAKAAPKAVHAIEEAEKHKGAPLTKLEKFKTGAPFFIPAAASSVITAGNVIGAGALGYSRQMALTGLLSASECALKEYQNKVAETIGEKQAREIKESIQSEHLHTALAAQPSPGIGVIRTGHGDELFLDDYSGRLFYSSETAILRAVNDYNAKIISSDNYASLNEFYDEFYMNLPHIKAGDYVGYNVDQLLEVRFLYEEPNHVYRIMTFENLPFADFARRY